MRPKPTQKLFGGIERERKRFGGGGGFCPRPPTAYTIERKRKASRERRWRLS